MTSEMGFKYKKSALKKMLSMSSKQQQKYSGYGYNLLKNEDVQSESPIFTDNKETITNKEFSQPFLAGIIAVLCFVPLVILLFPKILLFYQYGQYIDDADYEYATDRFPIESKIDFGSHIHDNETKIIADQLFNEVRILCLVMTDPENHEKKAQHVKHTWGPRCNKLLFMSSIEDTKLGTIALPGHEGRGSLWYKTTEAFKYVYKYHLEEYDWFMKADDETYVIVENLRKMLYSYNREFPIYFRSEFKEELKKIYKKSSPAYVLSKEALKRFVEKGLADTNKCGRRLVEYFEIVDCMENLEIISGDSRDEFERETMFPFLPAENMLSPRLNAWYWPFFFYEPNQGPDCCSDHAISFHKVSSGDMYELDYLIYHLRPFGIKPAPDVLPDKKSLQYNINAFSVPTNNISK